MAKKHNEDQTADREAAIATFTRVVEHYFRMPHPMLSMQSVVSHIGGALEAIRETFCGMDSLSADSALFLRGLYHLAVAMTNITWAGHAEMHEQINTAIGVTSRWSPEIVTIYVEILSMACRDLDGEHDNLTAAGYDAKVAIVVMYYLIAHRVVDGSKFVTGFAEF